MLLFGFCRSTSFSGCVPHILLQIELLLLVALTLNSIRAGVHGQDDSEGIGDDIVVPDDSTPISDWYQRYPQYPEYCSTPEQMSKRAIPPLPTFSSSSGCIPETRLRHVTAVIRHGATTISSRDSKCWDGYWDNPLTAIWNCPLTERLAPPPPMEILEEEGESNKSYFQPNSMFLFQQNFDAVPNRNVLEGSCQLGQLMAQGYEQLQFNGLALRETYLYEEGTMDHDERMRLFTFPKRSQSSSSSSTNSNSVPWSESNLYLRSEDYQPTLMSQQLLLQGLFGPELEAAHTSFFHEQEFATVPVHTADKTRDILQGYIKQCPRLDQLRQEARESEDFQTFYNSQESQEVRDFMDKYLVHDTELFDCLMTTVCTDRPLPDRFGVYNPHPESWMNRIAAYHATNHTLPFQYKNGEFSKLSMGPLWAEILDHITPVIREDSDSSDRSRPPSKLAIYSGHDTTLIQLLSSLGVWEIADWPPYASMMIIEIHEMVDDNYDKSMYPSGFAFRLLYDGNVLTSSIDGCSIDQDLCDAQVLLDQLLPIAVRGVNCDLVSDDTDNKKETPMVIAKSILSETMGIILLLIVITVSALLGSIGTYFYLTGTVPTEELIPKKFLPKSKKSSGSNSTRTIGSSSTAAAAAAINGGSAEEEE